ncbi:unnamed protein product [Arabidopsis arenosa]|uniref:Uncharacterized protein n=1 Tax=Arabidopsis arenosa TaxID=38785 RepID=A0A8S2A429_ARAAE|nr:unnamed protein product [Arabidopsis arenosa]
MTRVKSKLDDELSSPWFYTVCTMGGMLSAGTTHLAITPLDVLKVNMQVNPVKYNSIPSGFSTLLREHGYSYLWRGCSASAQIFADMALCPFEAIKVRVQTQPMFAKGLLDGFPRVYRSEGLAGFHRGLFPLWCRNLPFSMVMFSTFEQSVEFIYQNIIQKRKQDCSKAQQLGVTCLAGYTAGAVGTVISNPADVVLSSLYNNKAKSVLQAVRNIGFVGLFTRSLPVRITIVGPVITLQWFFYDAIKVLSGFPTSGGVKAPVDATKLSIPRPCVAVGRNVLIFLFHAQMHFLNPCLKLDFVAMDHESIGLYPLHRCKTIHLVRHAQGIHNVAGEKDHSAYSSEDYFDAHLTPLGWQQVDNLRNHVLATQLLNKVELVIVSPLLRTIQTAVGAFGGEEDTNGGDATPLMVANAGNSDRPAISSLNSPPFLAVELCRETMGDHPCDRRRSVTEYKALFPAIDFSIIETDKDVLWKPSPRESLEEVAARGVEFIKWIWTRKEKEIAIVSHSGFLHGLLSSFGKDCCDDIKKELSIHFSNCELRSMVIVDKGNLGTDSAETTNYPGKLPQGLDNPSG